MIAGLLLAIALIQGPVRSEVLRVIDGDTIEVDATFWPKLHYVGGVRVRGIDTPEAGGRAECQEEAILAEKAHALTELRCRVGSVAMLTEIGDDKYGDRVDAKVFCGGGSIGDALIEAGFARPYDGKKKSSWCPLQVTP